MKFAFVDTSYWVALLNKDYERHAVARHFQVSQHGFRLVTTELIVVELLNHFSARGNMLRKLACQLTRRVYAGDSEVSLVSMAYINLDKAIALYEQRGDKQWSLVDCSSFNLMRQFDINEALTADHHFEQAGFKSLLR